MLTTLGQQGLTSLPTRQVAVLVNELGRIAIDSQLIVGGGGDVLELAGGCLCCKIDVKNDLWDGIIDIIKRSAPDYVVLETTGIAEPQVILDDLDERLSAHDSKIAKQVKQAGVVCVVDSIALKEELARREEVKRQIVCADRFLLSKLDIADPEHLSFAHKKLGELAPLAEIASFPRGQELALANWLLADTPRQRSKQRASREHRHHGAQIVAVTFTSDAPLILELLLKLIEELRDALLRVKGIIRTVSRARPVVIELAGGRTTLSESESSSSLSQLVLIGEELDEPTIRRRLWACCTENQQANPAEHTHKA